MAKRGRNEQLVRVLQLVSDLLNRGGCDLYELAERHATTTRTIRRDLDALEVIGVPLRKTLSETGRVRWSIELSELRERGLTAVANIAFSVGEAASARASLPEGERLSKRRTP